MTNLALQADRCPNDDTLPDQEHDGPLALSGDIPVTIYIKAKPATDPTYSVLGLKPHGDFYAGGITWVCDGDFGKFITFEFLPDIASTDCDGLPYSPVVGTTQQLCILPTAPATYPFTVTFSSGRTHDPQIVVRQPTA